MKKTVKMILSLVLTLFVILSFGNPVKADDTDNYTITITRDGTPVSDDNHTYEAYQIFKGDISGEGNNAALNNIEWGSGIKSDNFLAALKTENNAIFGSCKDAYSVAEALTNSSFDPNRFAEIAAEHLDTSSGSGTRAINVTGAGYYIVKEVDANDPLKNTESVAYTDYLLKIVGDVEIELKDEVPSIKKVIAEGDGVVANDASIGDKVPYKVTSAVPDMTGYTKYFFVVEDELGTGLTFNNDVTIKVGENKLDKGVDYTVDTNGQKFEIIFNNFYDKYKDKKGAEIVIEYSATLNENADLTTAGNPNTVKLVYSNNPNATSTGDPSNPNKPGDNDYTGKTPESMTKTYVTEIEILKLDAKDQDEGKETPLSGAKFIIEGNGVKAVVINDEVYVEDTNGSWYMLKDGTFSETEPDEEHRGSDKKYKLVDKVTQGTASANVNKIFYTNANGKATIKGLAAGEYTITELEAPKGYNKLKNPVKVTISATYTNPETTMDCEFKVTGEGANINGNKVTIVIGNNKGTELPGTGGIGTTIFYIIGGILVAAAVVLFVTKKRVDAKEK